MIVPLFSGSGTRVKILEGMALGKTIITTSVGKEGIEGKDGVHFLVADEPGEMVAALEKGLESNVQDKIGSEAKSFVSQYYDHTNIAKDLIAKYNYLIANPY